MQDFLLSSWPRLVSFPISWFYLKLTYNHISHCPARGRRTQLPSRLCCCCCCSPASCFLSARTSLLASSSLLGWAGQLQRLHPFQPNLLPCQKKFLQPLYILILHVARARSLSLSLRLWAWQICMRHPGKWKGKIKIPFSHS